MLSFELEVDGTANKKLTCTDWRLWLRVEEESLGLLATDAIRPRTRPRFSLLVFATCLFTGAILLAAFLSFRHLKSSPSEVLELPWYHSKVIRDDPDVRKALVEYLNSVQDASRSWELCFRASEHRFSAYAFHAYCDNKGPTVTLVRVGENVFGGYADKSWDGNAGCFTHSTAAFLFQLKSSLSTRPYKLPACRNHGYALYSASNHGPTFGGGLDLRLDDRCNINTTLGVTTSYSNLGFTYQPQAGRTTPCNTTQTKYLLAGSFEFQCDEYEVFYQI